MFIDIYVVQCQILDKELAYFNFEILKICGFLFRETAFVFARVNPCYLIKAAANINEKALENALMV